MDLFAKHTMSHTYAVDLSSALNSTIGTWAKPLSRVAPHLFGHTKIYNMGVRISRHILPISHKIGSNHGMPRPSMVITLG